MQHFLANFTIRLKLVIDRVTSLKNTVQEDASGDTIAMVKKNVVNHLITKVVS